MDDMCARLEKRVESGEGPVGIGEAAKILGVEVGTLYQWRSHQKNVRSYKSGGKIVYDLADLLAYLEQHVSEPGPEGEHPSGKRDAA